MFAGKVHDLRRLCLGYFIRVSPALGSSFIMNPEHHMPCTFAIHVEELFYYVHDKIHWSVIVVQEPLQVESSEESESAISLVSQIAVARALFQEWRL
jgi:hypothetical protein